MEDLESERLHQISGSNDHPADAVRPFRPMMAVYPGSDLSIEQLVFALEKAVATDFECPRR